MMKKAWKLAASLALALVLAGCHGSQGMNTFEVPESLDTSRTFELSFWAKNDTNKAQTNIYEKAIADFEALYPNIHVTMRLYTDYGKIYNDVITNIATNTTPNICITYPDHIATYLTGSNTVVELNPLFEDDQFGFAGSEVRFDGPRRDEVIDQFLNECMIKDAYYAIPYMRSTEACYVNKTYVEKLGFTVPEVMTWDFMFEVAEAALAKDENGNYLVNGQNIMIPIIYKSTDNMMIQMLKQKNAGYSTEDGEVLLFNDTTKDLLNMVAKHAESGAFSTFKISSYPANFLNAGQCIFAVDSTAGSTWMGTYAPLSDISEDKFVEFETAVLPVPQFDTENIQMISQGPSICIFNKRDPQEVAASWLFAQYLLSNDVQIPYAETEGYIPVTSKAQNSAEYQDYLSRSGEDNTTHYNIKISASNLLLEHINETFVTPVFNGSTSLRDAAGQMIENTAKSVRRGETVNDAYFEKLFSSVTSLYHLDQISGMQTTGENSISSLGKLPGASVALLTTLVITWLILGAAYFRTWQRKKKNSAKSN